MDVSRDNISGNSRGLIVYLGAFRYPDKDAAALRVRGIGKILRSLNFRVVFAGGEQGDEQENVDYEGFPYYSQSELDLKSSGVIKKITAFCNSGHRTLKWLEGYVQEHKVSAIIVYNSSYIFQTRIIKFCKKNKIKIIGDCTEWYDSSHLPGGRYGIVSIDNLLKMYVSFPKIKNIIAISQYLSNFYGAKHNCKTIVIPPLNEDLKQSSVEITNTYSENVNLIYVGNAGQKDDIYTITKIIVSDNTYKNVILHIVGITNDQFCSAYGEIKIQKNIRFYGRLNHSDVGEIYKIADFSFIIRPNKRYANAGFPTKFVESMSWGVPVITTSTSDIPFYLENDVNGFLLENCLPESIRKVLDEILSKSSEDIFRMKTKAFELSKRFDLQNYCDKMSIFLKEIKL